jgi:hypothetical protein
MKKVFDAAYAHTLHEVVKTFESLTGDQRLRMDDILFELQKELKEIENSEQVNDDVVKALEAIDQIRYTSRVLYNYVFTDDEDMRNLLLGRDFLTEEESLFVKKIWSEYNRSVDKQGARAEVLDLYEQGKCSASLVGYILGKEAEDYID